MKDLLRPLGTFKFWKEQDEAAAIAYELASRKAKPAVNPANKNTVRVTRTQYRVYRRVDNRKPALSPAPLRKDLHLRRGGDRQMKTAA